MAAINTVAAGDALLSPSVTRRVITRFTHMRPASPPAELEDLTAREHDGFRLIARGLSNAEIATEIYVSEATVKTPFTHVLQKLGLRDRVQAVVLAHRIGLVQARDNRLAD